jgi:hypothetical protein
MPPETSEKGRVLAHRQRRRGKGGSKKKKKNPPKGQLKSMLGMPVDILLEVRLLEYSRACRSLFNCLLCRSRAIFILWISFICLGSRLTFMCCSHLALPVKSGLLPDGTFRICLTVLRTSPSRRMRILCLKNRAR